MSTINIMPESQSIRDEETLRKLVGRYVRRNAA